MDVLYWLLLLSHDLDIDIKKAFGDKGEKNEKKYPVEKSRGSRRKYTESSIGKQNGRDLTVRDPLFFFPRTFFGSGVSASNHILEFRRASLRSRFPEAARKKREAHRNRK